MSEQMEIKQKPVQNPMDLMTLGPIIHLPETARTCYRKTSNVVMVTNTAKVKVSNSSSTNKSKKAEKTIASVLINPRNFNLFRPGKSKEVVNGLQRLLSEQKEAEARQQKESAKILLSFLRKRKASSELSNTENFNIAKIDAGNLKVKEELLNDRFGPVRDSIELTERSVKKSGKNWLPPLDPLVSVQLIHPASDQSAQPAIHLPESGACKGYTVTSMTTALPKITPCSTPLPPTMAPVRSHSSASMYSSYGAYPPPELSSSSDFANIPKRNNPLVPPPPLKRINWSWETVDRHHENEKRRLLMQKREHTRYHSAWSKAFYGSPAESEAYRRHFREVLKQQMADKDVAKKHHMQQKIKETDRAIAYDRECRKNDAQEYFRKHHYLMKFRDGNKNLMENTWDAKRYNKFVEDRIDRERLRYNPINWSCSLK